MLWWLLAAVGVVALFKIADALYVIGAALRGIERRMEEETE